MHIKNSFLRDSLVIKLALMVVIFSGGCTWVKLSEDANKVSLVSSKYVTSCTKIGTTTSKVLDKVAFVKRSERKQKEELATLAKNEAFRMGGNTIVADGDIEDGRQKFSIYQCGGQ